MRPLEIEKIIEITGGTLLSGDGTGVITNVVTDSREAGEGTLFVPIVGERVDAHRFIENVMNQGAALSFSSNKECGMEGKNILYVEDTLQALQETASYYRSQFELPLVGVTGSVGKTTTKEMIAAVLETKYKVLKTFGNMNSQIGLALMMFHIEEDTEIAVIEMGMSMPGEMDRLSKIAKPTCAVMTNVGVSHIGNLGSREKICYEKGKIVTSLPEGGKLFLCGNGDLIDLAKNNLEYSRCPNQIKQVTYGTENDCDVMGTNLCIQGEETHFLYEDEKESVPVRLSLLGNHFVNNALVAILIGKEYGVPTKDALDALYAYEPMKMRGEKKEAAGMVIIDDTYNASPDSILSGIDMLLDYSKAKRRIAVLADVLELGEWSEKNHRDIGKYIEKQAETGRTIDMLFTVGQEASYIAKEVTSPEVLVYPFEERKDAIKKLMDVVLPGDYILVKGSRGMAMDKVVDALMTMKQ